MSEPTYWGVHADSGRAQELFLSKARVAVGWPELGDLSKIGHDRELLKAALKKAYPDKKPGAIPVYAGEIFRFIDELAIGDVVVYRSRPEPIVHLGRVTGPYAYDPAADAEYPNMRPVKWFRKVPVIGIKEGAALFELGAFLSFFQIKSYSAVWAALAAGESAEPVAEVDVTLAAVSAATEQSTRDFVRKQIATELKGHPFAHFVANLLRTMGYRTRVSPEGADGGIDIIAHRDELGLEPPIIKVQVKSAEGSIGGPTVAELLGNLGPADHGLFVALGTFSPQAKAKAGDRVRLINGEELVDLVLSHYEELDSSYKRVIPLKRLYVPQVGSEE
jgi:restriction system protein